MTPAAPVLPVAARRGSRIDAGIRPLPGSDRTVGWFHLPGEPLGVAEGETAVRVVDAAVSAGVPVVGVLATPGPALDEGIASLHVWGRLAAALTRASGVVPITLVVDGPCTGSGALVLGLADVVVMTPDAVAYVNGPAAIRGFTAARITVADLGGQAAHATSSGVATLEAHDLDDALAAVDELLDYLPANNLTAPPVVAGGDPYDRPCTTAAATVPPSATASYDVRVVMEDICDEHSVLELRPRHAPNIVTALARIDGHTVGIVANQPCRLAGTLDIAASQKGARFVQWCDAFNVPILTFVDTPGFQPGKDLEWRGMIRHGAELVHAYAGASVPRLCVIVRKAYGGAYIVMDSKTMGNDVCLSWPAAEIAVMGASGAVEILHGRRLKAMEDPTEREEERVKLEAEYAARYCSPAVAAERGYVDEIVEPAETRRILAEALAALASKREHTPRRKHSNSPL